MFERFVPLQEACLSEYSELISGTMDIIEARLRRGEKHQFFVDNMRRLLTRDI